MDEMITKEIKYFHKALEGLKGQSFDIKEQLSRTVANVMNVVTFGRRFDYDSPELALLRLEGFLTVAGAIITLPFLRVRVTLAWF